jgi:ribosome-binding ATPase YchF (GTP1/OBG family)
LLIFFVCYLNLLLTHSY